MNDRQKVFSISYPAVNFTASQCVPRGEAVNFVKKRADVVLSKSLPENPIGINTGGDGGAGRGGRDLVIDTQHTVKV